MLDFTAAKIEQVSSHQIGNKTNGEELYLSTSLIDIEDDRVKELLFKFFLNPFATPEFHQFTFSNEDFTLNPLFHFATKIFEDDKTLHQGSLDIAKHLYEISTHPQIKSGDLFVAYFSNLGIADIPMDAIGIFKSEN